MGKHYLDGPEPDDGKALFFLSVAAKVYFVVQSVGADAIRQEKHVKSCGDRSTPVTNRIAVNAL